MRRISPGTVTIFVIAILVGLMGAFVLKQQMSLQPIAEIVEPEQMVVISRMNLSANERVSRSILELRPARDGEAVANAISEIDVVVGRHIRETLAAQTPITEEDLFPIGENPIKRLTERIADGMRAITIQVTGLVHGRTLIQHDSTVDIALTIETDHPDVKEVGLKGIGTKTLLQTIRVLAVIIPPESPRSSAAFNALTSIVVEVTPDQANTLALAQQIGNLSVSVVGNGSAGPGAQERVVKPNDLIGLVSPAPPEPPALPPSPPVEETFQVEHYRGDTMELRTFGPDKIKEAHSLDEPKSSPSEQPGFQSSSSTRPVRQPWSDRQTVRDQYEVDKSTPPLAAQVSFPTAEKKSLYTRFAK